MKFKIRYQYPVGGGGAEVKEATVEIFDSENFTLFQAAESVNSIGRILGRSTVTVDDIVSISPIR